MKNPVTNTSLATGLVQAVIALLVAFGISLSADQIAAIMGVAGAVLLVVGAYFHPKIPVGRRAKSNRQLAVELRAKHSKPPTTVIKKP